MKRLIAFWRKDLVNKLIILTAAGLAVAAVILTVVVLRMPAGKSLRGAIAAYAPLPVTATPTGTPTTTPYPEWTPRPSRTPTATPPVTPSETPPASPDGTGGGPVASASATASLTPTALPSGKAGKACIPANPSQTGTVLEIQDGNTIRVLVDDKVYVVRYLGLITPDAENPFAAAATSKNSELVYGRAIKMIPDSVDKDASGRLLRYVTVGDTFVNLELLNQGLASFDDNAPAVACAGAFTQAESAARQAKRGQWSLPPTP